jgi:hypothetical protein
MSSIISVPGLDFGWTALGLWLRFCETLPYKERAGDDGGSSAGDNAGIDALPPGNARRRFSRSLNSDCSWSITTSAYCWTSFTVAACAAATIKDGAPVLALFCKRFKTFFLSESGIPTPRPLAGSSERDGDLANLAERAPVLMLSKYAAEVNS